MLMAHCDCWFHNIPLCQINVAKYTQDSCSLYAFTQINLIKLHMAVKIHCYYFLLSCLVTEPIKFYFPVQYSFHEWITVPISSRTLLLIVALNICQKFGDLASRGVIQKWAKLTVIVIGVHQGRLAQKGNQPAPHKLAVVYGNGSPSYWVFSMLFFWMTSVVSNRLLLCLE